MSSSELSNALNPHAVARPRARHGPVSALSASSTTPVLATQPPAPHRSELELAIAPPLPPAEPYAVAPQSNAQQLTRNANPVVELYKVVATAREAAAAERKRRIAWEQEQEAKAAQRQQELERQVLEMREEITLLKAYISMRPNVPAASGFEEQPFVNNMPMAARIDPMSPATESSQTPVSPVSPVPPHSTVEQTMFVQGSSSHPLETQFYVSTSAPTQQTLAPPVISPPTSTASSPQFAPARPVAVVALRTESSDSFTPPTPQSGGVPSASVPPSPKQSPNARKRPRQVEVDSDSPSESDDDPDDATSERPRDRAKDGRCTTIHHAMRIHVRRMMKLKHGEDLPPSHFEGAPLLADQPVRFVWTKTTKQSAHNAAMKRRIVNDLRANRGRYKRVADKDFTKKTLDSVFDQVFTTLRQKFKAQNDTGVATRLQRRENQKALRARRVQRKKTKLSNRVDARKRLDAFAQPVFESALHLDCMSSEESDGEYVENGEKVQVFRTRGPPWRSARLLRYYAILDGQDRLEKSMKPKRGLGRRDRREGLPKDGLFLPPKGVARWMVSRRWLQETEAMRPDLVDVFRELLVDVQDESELARVMLGSEQSDEEAEQEPPPTDVYAHVSDTSYSLHNALQPV
ncbi:hypothetical protein BD413DRAFT_491100 [Trametes elegans]|nr:hypothetical protein BD413DRAFT_491100 [Trametes elegans]